MDLRKQKQGIAKVVQNVDYLPIYRKKRKIKIYLIHEFSVRCASSF